MFDHLRQQLQRPDLAAQFDEALREEHRRLQGGDLERDLMRTRRRLQESTKARRRIMAANGHGADYGEYRARGIVLKAEQRALEAELRSLEDRREIVSRPPPDTAAIFADALSNMEALLGDPELVHQANEFLREIVRSIILQPDDRAPDGLAAEIHTGLGSLLFWDR